MAYIPVTDKDILYDINSRNEFISFMQISSKYKKREEYAKIMDLNRNLTSTKFLEFYSYQLAFSNYINPNTKIKRIFSGWATGIGKTIGAIAAALKFIPFIRRNKLAGKEDVGSIFIIGFSSSIFKKQLLQFPELGFITRGEIEKIEKMKQLISSGIASEKKNLRELLIMVRRRFNNRYKNGFFKFIGYKALVNKLFVTSIKGVSINKLTYEELDSKIKNGSLQINEEFLFSFRNSLCICDEIHNVYNTLNNNNWGAALQYIIDTVGSAKWIYMSATPFNNSSAEIVSFLNLLVPKDDISIILGKGIGIVKKSALFEKNGKLKIGALKKIKNLTRGRISYIRDNNPKFFPERLITGEKIRGISYLKFMRCPMTSEHYGEYKKNITDRVPSESRYLIDIILPSPSPDKKYIYTHDETRRLLANAPDKWKSEHELSWKDDKIVGAALNIKNLRKISAKYYSVIKDLLHLVINDRQSGKFLIIHPAVHMSGVLFMEEVLLQNGFVGEFDSSSENTLCSICGKIKKDHAVKKGVVERVLFVEI